MGYSPGEGLKSKLQILVGQPAQPDWYVALFYNNSHALDYDLAYGNLDQPTDPLYVPVLLNPLFWTFPSSSYPELAVYPTVNFYFANPVTILGWFIYGDLGAGNVVLVADWLNYPSGVAVPAGGAQLGLNPTIQDYSTPPPP